MLFNIFLTLNICTLLILFFFIYFYQCEEAFENKNTIHSDYIDAVKGKYNVLKSGKNEKSLLSKIKFYNNTK
jgi:hypothetical protein